MKTAVVLLCITAVWALPGAAQPPLSLREAVALGLRQNPELRAATEQLEATTARTQTTRAAHYPVVRYSESWTRSDNPVFVFSSLLTQHQFGPGNFDIGLLNRPGFLDNFRSSLSATQTLWDGGVTGTRIEQANLNRDFAAEQNRATQAAVIALIVRAYSGAVLAEERARSAESAVHSAEADLKRAVSMRDAGMTTDMDVLSIRVHLSAITEQRITAVADRAVARAALNQAVGVPLDDEHLLSTFLGLSPNVLRAITSRELSELERDAAKARAEARQSELATSLARTENRLARDARKPVISFESSFEADRQDLYRKGGANLTVGVSLNWTVFDGNATIGRIRETQHLVSRAEANNAEAQSGIRLQVRRAWADLQAAGQRIETATATVAESEESLRITRNRYQAGLSTVTDLIRAETATLETRTRVLTALHDQRVAAAMLEFASGSLSLNSEVLQ